MAVGNKSFFMCFRNEDSLFGVNYKIKIIIRYEFSCIFVVANKLNDIVILNCDKVFSSKGDMSVESLRLIMKLRERKSAHVL